jgi:elongation factor Ts
MVEITADVVRKLREATNVSMMECKRALVEAEGDMAKATKLLRERGIAVAAKKAARTANQGLLASVGAADGRVASLVEVNCETDFVARNATFAAFVKKLAAAACETDGSLADTVRDEVVAKIAEIGENIVVRRNLRYVLQGTGALGSYIHLGGKVGVLVEVAAEKDATARHETFLELVKDLTLHVAACAPHCLTPSDVPAAEIASEREIYAKQVKDKPPQIIDKIVDGKMKKFYSEVCLLEQPFVKEAKQSVAALLAEKGKALGDKLSVRRFVRWQLGE